MKVIEAVQAYFHPKLNYRVKLSQQFGNSRFVANRCKDFCDPLIGDYVKLVKGGHKKLAKKKRLYPTRTRLNRYLMSLKVANRWLYTSNARSLQLSYQNLLNSYQRHFKLGAGWPKYQSRKYYRQSFTIDSHSGFKHDAHHFKIPNLGWVRVHYSMPIVGQIKQITVVHDNTGRYYISIHVECEKQPLPKTGKMIGIDVGLNHLLTLSNGMKYDFKYFDKFVAGKKHYWEKREARRRKYAERVIRHYRKEHARNSMYYVLSLRDFRNYQKARKMVAKYARKAKNQRKNYLEWLTTRLVEEYDFIAIEDIQVKPMMHNHHLARSISNGAWRIFRTMLTYKCNWYGKHLEVVDKNNTTQKCFNCGYNMSKHGQKIQLGVEHWTCPNCYTSHDRDVNAALNILRRGLDQAMDKSQSTALSGDSTGSDVSKNRATKVSNKKAPRGASDTRYFSAE